MHHDLASGRLHERSVSGRSGTFGLDTRRRSTLEIFASSVSEPTYTDAICRRKFRVWLNKNATVRMCGCLPRLPAQNPSLRAQQSSRPQVRFVVVSVFPKYQFRLITKLDHKTPTTKLRPQNSVRFANWIFCLNSHGSKI
jgi:hypothetical protein